MTYGSEQLGGITPGGMSRAVLTNPLGHLWRDKWTSSKKTTLSPLPRPTQTNAFSAGQVPVSTYGGSEKDLKDLMGTPRHQHRSGDEIIPYDAWLACGGLVCKVHRLFYHSTLGLRVIKKEKKKKKSVEDVLSTKFAGEVSTAI